MLAIRRRITDAASPAAWTVMRRASSAFQRTPTAVSPADEGDWVYAREWWGDKVDGHEVFRADSEKGNGVVSVVAYSSSRPDPVQWPAVESWLQQRYMKLHPGCEDSGRFRILGYQWRTLRFNDNTRQSTAKVMAAYRLSDPGFVYIMQQPHCLAVPYLKSMISAGLTTLACCPYSYGGNEERPLNVLCVGHGGGSLPLFLASKLPGAVVHVVEIDPVVISASVQAMGFPASVIRQASESSEFDLSTNLLWGHIHQKLFLYESDAENFLLREPTVYDLIFLDAYDGDDIFPHKLWDPNGPFLEALGRHLHPKHGTVVVNLHSDSDVLSEDESASPLLHHILPMGKCVSQVCKAYKTALLGGGGLGLVYTVSVPWLCNISLVVSRGIIHRGDRNTIVNNLCSKAIAVENALHLPFSCLQYMKRRIVLV